ncbi:MAG: hypothetical protein LAQ30_23260 [Acidobacteriia bacterium]|nr:hypothetical protein [Terriglobia bacterium]
MRKLRSLLGNTGAVLTLAAALLTPFLLLGWFQRAIGSAGLRVHPEYSGGEIARVVERGDYRIEVFRPVPRSSPLQRIGPFVQMAWKPAARLPARVSDEVDVDGDGAPDLLVSFDPARLEVAVAPRNARFQAMRSAGVTSFSALIARVGDAIVVRAPLAAQ